MPRYSEPSAPLPKSAEEIIDILGANRARVAILLYLSEHPGTTRTEIANSTGVGAHTVYRHLLELEQIKAIHADVPTEDRSGRNVRYTLDNHAVRVYLTGIRRHFQ